MSIAMPLSARPASGSALRRMMLDAGSGTDHAGPPAVPRTLLGTRNVKADARIRTGDPFITRASLVFRGVVACPATSLQIGMIRRPDMTAR